MQKIMQALDRLNRAIDQLADESAQRAAAQRQATAQYNESRRNEARLDEAGAHLRADISSLKKTNEKLENSRRRAAQQVEKAMEQIDDVLGDKDA